MTKMNWLKNPFVLGIGAAAIIIILVVGLGIKFPTGTILSLGQTKVITTNPLLCSGTCDLWLSTIALDGSGQAYSATFSATEVQPTGTQRKATAPVTISFHVDSQLCSYGMYQETQGALKQAQRFPVTVSFNYEYPIGLWVRYIFNGDFGARNDNNQLGTSDYGSRIPTDSQFNAAYQTKCSQNGGMYFVDPVVINGVSRQNNYCFRMQYADVARSFILNSPQATYSATMTVTGSGGTDTAHISTVQQGTSYVGNGGKIAIQTSYLGLPSNGQWCPTNALPKYLQLINSNNRMQPVASFDIAAVPQFVNIQNGADVDDINTQIYLFNNIYNNILATGCAPASSCNSAYENAFNDYTTVVSGTSSVKLDYTTQPKIVPIVQLFSNADWMGIILPTGKPAIVGTPVCSFTAGTSGGSVPITIRNDGDDNGKITASMTCSNPKVSVNNNPLSFTLAHGTQQTQAFQVTGTALTSTETVACTYHASGDFNAYPVDVNGNCVVQTQCNLPQNPPFVIQYRQDGTCYYACLLTDNQCATGQHVDTNTCTCVGGITPSPSVSPSPSVPPLACTDGTPYGQCSANTRGLMCINGTLTASDLCKDKQPDWTLYLMIGIVIILVLAILYYLGIFGKKGKSGRGRKK